MDSFQADQMGLLLPRLWMKTLCEGSVDDVLALYAESCCLVPTYGDSPLYGKDALRSYFEEFTSSRPKLCGEIYGREIDQRLGSDYRAVSGTYNFVWDGEDGERVSQNARYTFVIEPGTDPEWVIHTHHSSEVPDERE